MSIILSVLLIVLISIPGGIILFIIIGLSRAHYLDWRYRAWNRLKG